MRDNMPQPGRVKSPLLNTNVSTVNIEELIRQIDNNDQDNKYM